MPVSDTLRSERALIAEYREFAEQVRAAAAGTGRSKAPPAGIPRKLVRETNRDLVRAFSRELRKAKWRFVVEGEHYSGLSNQALLEVRQREGREFDAATVQLDQWVSKELAERYNGFDARVVTRSELEDLAGKLIAQRIAERMLHGGLDVGLAPLTPRYAAWKRKQGKGSKPIGVFTGRHAQAIRRKGRVVWG